MLPISQKYLLLFYLSAVSFLGACSYSREPLCYQVLADESFSAEEATRRFEQDSNWKEGIFNAGITAYSWWMLVTLPEQWDESKYFFMLNNPHINLLEIYFSDAVSPTYIMGDHLPFDQRPYWNKDLVVPLEYNGHKPTSLLLKMSKPGETLLVDPMILKESLLLQKVSLETLLIGLFIGWMAIMFMGACLYAIKLKEISGILYALFILSLTSWLCSHWGLGFQYIWPNAGDWTDKSRPVLGLITNTFFLLLMTSFFPPLRKKSWLIYAVKITIALHVLLAIDTFFRPMSTINIPNKMTFLKLTLGFSILVTALIITYLWQQYRAGIQYAAYYLLGISFLIGFNLLVHLHQAGISILLSQSLFDFGSSFGMMGETIFITAAFIGKAADFKVEQENLQLKLVENEKLMANKLIDVQEKERNRLARDLHDSIGGMLASIYLKASQLETQFSSNEVTHELKDLVSKSIVEARSISHNLTPPHLKETGLELSLRTQLQLIQDQAHLPITFTYSLPANISQNLQLSLYRVCGELVQNVLKHAQASELMIHLLEVDGEVEVIVEDDGRGFDPKQSKSGIGLTNIQDRVSYWKGTLAVDSTPSGTTVLIRIPLVYEYAS